jgi:hypothetical protein
VTERESKEVTIMEAASAALVTICSWQSCPALRCF